MKQITTSVRQEKKLERDANRESLGSGSPGDNVTHGSGLSAFKQVVANIDFGASQPQDIYFDRSQNGFVSYNYFIQAYINMLAKKTPVFVSDPSFVNRLSPPEVYYYCWTWILMIVKAYGKLTGNGVENIPSIKDVEIHLPLLKFLQYLMPFRCGMVIFRSRIDIDLTAINYTSGVLDSPSVAASGLGSWPQWEGGLDQRLVNLRNLPALGSGHLVQDPNPTIPGQFLNFVKTRFDEVHYRMMGLAVPKISINGISLFAPDSSHYVSLITSGSSTNIQAYHQFYDREMATVFAGDLQVADNIPGLLTRLEVKYDLLVAVEPTLRQYIAHCVMAHLFLVDEWIDGPVLDMPFLGQKITSHIFQPKVLDGQTFKAVTFEMYRAARDTNPQFLDNSTDSPTSYGPYGGFVLMWIMCLIQYHHRADQTCPFPIFGRSATNTNVIFPQSYYNPGVNGMLVPASLKTYINSMGYAIINGSVVFPMIDYELPNPSDAFRLFFLNMSGFSWLLGDPDTFPYSPFISSTALLPGIILSDTKYDNAEMTSLHAQLATGDVMTYMPVAYYEQFQAEVMSLYKTIGNILGNMVSFSSHECYLGCNYQMLAMPVGSAGVTYSITPNVVSSPAPSKEKEQEVVPKGKLKSPVPSAIVIRSKQAAGLLSIIPLSRSETVLGIAYNNSDSSAQRIYAPFRIDLPRRGIISAFYPAVTAQSFTPNLLDPGSDNIGSEPVRIGGETIYRNCDSDDNKGSKTFLQSLAGLASSLLPKSAYNMACDGVAFGVGYIPVVGPIASPYTKQLCDWGLPKVVNYIADRSVATTEESPCPKPIQTCSNSRGVRVATVKKELGGVLRAGVANDHRRNPGVPKALHRDTVKAVDELANHTKVVRKQRPYPRRKVKRPSTKRRNVNATNSSRRGVSTRGRRNNTRARNTSKRNPKK